MPSDDLPWFRFNPATQTWICLTDMPTDPKLKTALELIFSNDIAFTVERDAHYESSWKRRGGAGAFFTIARPWDRFEAIAKRGVKVATGSDPAVANSPYLVQPYDIFGIIQYEQDKGLSESNDGTLQACIRDLRIYMGLLAAEALNSRAAYVAPVGTKAVPAKELFVVGDRAYYSPKEEAARG